jgi:hypothetical protein
MRSIIILLSSMVFSHLASAINQPSRCPGILDLREAGLHTATLVKTGHDYNVYDVHHRSYYNTQQNWDFYVWNVRTKASEDSQHALTQAKQALNTLTGKPTPIEDILDRQTWVCHYLSYAYSAYKISAYVLP